MVVIKLFLFIACAIDAILVIAGETPKITILEHSFTVAPDNPYYGQWSSEIIPPGDGISMKTPIINDIPEDVRTKSVITVDGEIILNEDVLLCEKMENEEVKEMNEYGIPEDKFPKQCPIKTCEECEIVNYKIPTDKIPPGFSPAKFVEKTIIYKDDENSPYLTIDAVYELSYE